MYVTDIEASRRFYELFGYEQTRSGSDGDSSRWSHLQCRDLTMLLASVTPPLITVELPLLTYLFVDDLDATVAALTAAGHPVERTGHPEHAPAGEARTRDPDNNVVLLGQRAVVPAQAQPDQTAGATARLSLLRQAAQAISQRGDAPDRCQIGGPQGQACTRQAAVKLADSWGDTVWGCIDHAEETLLNARGAFLANKDDLGLRPFLRARQSPYEPADPR
ncbi:VOC family protein [Micromonospora sp. BQ11]|uniref:VOC family protein n=1 Tax=Micromonospora sp. BQ11 TaxID=3452212 RepID=UPI003F88E6C9